MSKTFDTTMKDLTREFQIAAGLPAGLRVHCAIPIDQDFLRPVNRPLCEFTSIHETSLSQRLLRYNALLQQPWE